MLYSGIHDNGKEFFGDILPSNLHTNTNALERLTAKLKTLLKFNVWCEVILCKYGNYFLIKDTMMGRPL